MLCKIKECESKAVRRGFCRKHYNEVVGTRCKVKGCSNFVTSKALCSKHYSKFVTYGDPTYEKVKQIHGLDIRERFWANVGKERKSGCIQWAGYCDPNGYGRLHIGNKSILAHRLSWEIQNGPIPEGMFVLHKCDNPSCIRTGDENGHLFLGNQNDNIQDSIQKGRARSGGLVGEKHIQSKLTEIQVMRIRRSKLRGIELAEKYKVATTTISDVQKGKIWKHLPFDQDRADANKRHKLTEVDVAAIRGSTESSKVLAERYGVTERNISDVRYGHTWQDLPGAIEPDEISPFAKKFTDADVVAIRASDETAEVLAERYGVTIASIDNIHSGKTWKHLPHAPRDKRRHRNAKITERDVLAIRASESGATKLSEEYGISLQNIYAIRQRRSWKHI